MHYVYSLKRGNLKWMLRLLSSILSATSQLLITLSFLTFAQRCIMIGFFRFLYSGQSGIRSQTKSFGETSHCLSCCSFPCLSLVYSVGESLLLYISHEVYGGRTKKNINFLLIWISINFEDVFLIGIVLKE